MAETLFRTEPGNRLAFRLTAAGRAAVGEMGSIESSEAPAGREQPDLVEHALRAHLGYQKDRDYVVRDGAVVLVDEYTGRLLPGRRWSEGLHQAVECREGVEIRPDTETLATIRFQEFFGLYRRLAGLSGTAKADADFFRQAYSIDVAAVPTRRPLCRVEHEDRVYRDEEAKLNAVVEEVRHYSGDLGRPVLVGVRDIDHSEKLSDTLTQAHGIAHEVLNARPSNVSREAEIVGAAGRQRPAEDGSGKMVGAVTIATNMAGRGTDIELGPGVVNQECLVPSEETLGRLGVATDPVFASGCVKCCVGCLEFDGPKQCAHCFKPKVDPNFPDRGRGPCREGPPCGLHVVGTERHDSRRQDDQLRGRAGKQGEPGSSRFFLSLDDELLQHEALRDELQKCGCLATIGDDGTEDRRLSRAIERGQQKIQKENCQRVLTLSALE